MPNYHITLETSKPDYARNRKGKYTIHTEFSELELRELDGLAALEGLEALAGIFTTLLMFDFSNYFQMKKSSPIDMEDFNNTFRSFAELGSNLTDACYGKLSECLEGYEKLMKEGGKHLSE